MAFGVLKKRPERTIIIEGLIRRLKRGRDRYDRYTAANSLGEMHAIEAVEPLIEALGDKSPDVRGMVAKALGSIGDRHAIEPLIVALNDSSGWVRGCAAVALAAIGSPDTAATLAATLVDIGYGPKVAVVAALDRFGWLPGKDEAGAHYWIVKGEWDKVEVIGMIAMPALDQAFDGAFHSEGYTDDYPDEPDFLNTVAEVRRKIQAQGSRTAGPGS